MITNIPKHKEENELAELKAKVELQDQKIDLLLQHFNLKLPDGAKQD